MPIIIDGLANPKAIQQTVEAIKAMPSLPYVPCRHGCTWYMGWPHDKDCPGTRGVPPQPLT